MVWPLVVLGVLLVNRGRRSVLLLVIGALTIASVVRMSALYDAVDRR